VKRAAYRQQARPPLQQRYPFLQQPCLQHTGARLGQHLPWHVCSPWRHPPTAATLLAADPANVPPSRHPAIAATTWRRVPGRIARSRVNPSNRLRSIGPSNSGAPSPLAVPSCTAGRESAPVLGTGFCTGVKPGGRCRVERGVLGRENRRDIAPRLQSTAWSRIASILTISPYESPYSVRV
jgi:hypothetical protein